MYKLDDAALEYQRKVNDQQPQVPINFRYPLFGGKSGADVYLVDFLGDEGQQLGVIKIASRKAAEREAAGFAAAKQSWLKNYLPEKFAIIGELDGNRVAILTSLARDRLDDCVTLDAVLNQSFGYAKDHLLFSLAYAYRIAAESEWAKSRTSTIRDCFLTPLTGTLSQDWEKRWEAASLPGKSQQGLVFEDQPERWPNPIALLHSDELWKDIRTTIKIPWIESHGDLNSRNILSLSYQRAIAHGIIGKTTLPERILEHLSLIDLPFFRIVPFPYDLAFLATTLIDLLPSFSVKANRQSVLQVYKAVLDSIMGNPPQFGVPHSGNNFYETCNVIFRQLKFAQKRVEKDTELACLASLAGASLWRAIKAVDRQDVGTEERELATNLTCLSSLALKALFEHAGTRHTIDGEDFRLWIDPKHIAKGSWTESTRIIANQISIARSKGQVLLVMGRDFSSRVGILPDAESQRLLKDRNLHEINEALEKILSSEQKHVVQSISILEPTAILDWSMFPCLRRAFSESVAPPKSIKPILPSTKDIDLNDREAIFYFHWRGSFEEISGGLGLTARERNAIRSSHRDKLSRICKKRSSNHTVIYVGVPAEDIQEVHEELQQVWRQRLNALFVGTVPSAQLPYFDDWQIQSVNGTIDDFVTACEGFQGEKQPKPMTKSSKGVGLTVLDVKRDDDGSLVSSSGSKHRIDVPEADYSSICRAGHLFIDADFEREETLKRDPRDFFIGHRIQMEEIAHKVPIERDLLKTYATTIEEALATSKPTTVKVLAQPGAGATTLIYCLAREFAARNIPTLVLDQGGNVAFDAIEKIARLVGRSFLVIADIENVSADDSSGLVTRSVPSQYPVVLVTSQRLLSTPREDLPLLTNGLSDGEKVNLVERLSRYCSGLNIGSLLHSETMSLFMISLMAFGGENVNLLRFVSSIMDCATPSQRYLIAVIAFFSRYGNRASTSTLLEAVAELDKSGLESELSLFRDLLIIQEREGWACRHDMLSEKILQYHLTQRFDEGWRFELAEFTVKLFKSIDRFAASSDIFAEYVWSALNPRLDASFSETNAVPRLIWSPQDGIPENPGRNRVYLSAVEQFPEHVNIVSHYGKYLSEIEGKYTEAERYLNQALESDPSNSAIMHMLGMRFSDEVKSILRGNPATARSPEIQARIETLALSAHEWFDKARNEDFGSEYNYTAPIQLDVRLIEDQFKIAGVASVEDDPSILSTEKVASLLTRADRIVADGLNFINPDKEKRRYFTQARDELERLRGDLEKAITSFQKRIPELSGSNLSAAKVQLARLLRERGHRHWKKDKTKAAIRDFESAQIHLASVLEDPARSYDNIGLWFDCARYLKHWTREDLLDKLHSLHSHRHSPDSCFLLMCLYFADAVQTGSMASWRRCGEFQHESSRRFASFAVRTYLREWLVEYDVGSAKEYRVFPHHLFGREMSVEDSEKSQERTEEDIPDLRVRLQGTVTKVHSSTSALLKVAPWGFDVFFKPRVKDNRYYKEDEGRTKVDFFVAFTYDKPLAYDVTRIEK